MSSLTYAHHLRHNGAKMEEPEPEQQQPRPNNPNAPMIGNINSPSVSVASVSSEDEHKNVQANAELSANDTRYLQLELQRLTEAMSRLRRAFADTADRGSEYTRGVTTERLGEMLGILRPLLTRYPDLKTTEVMGAAESLIELVKHSVSNFGDYHSSAEDFFEALDAFGAAIHNSVTDYVASNDHPMRTSPNIVFPSYSEATSAAAQHSSDAEFLSAELNFNAARRDAILTVDQVDALLMRHDRGVDIALERAKIWSKYAKDVINYVEKRIGIELEWAKNMAKLAQERRPVLKEESHLPFQSNYCIALDVVSQC